MSGANAYSAATRPYSTGALPGNSARTRRWNATIDAAPNRPLTAYIHAGSHGAKRRARPSRKRYTTDGCATHRKSRRLNGFVVPLTMHSKYDLASQYGM